MHDLRTSTALRQLADLGDDPGPRRWAWSVGSPDADGRLPLSAAARGALAAQPGRRTRVIGVVQRQALVVTPDGVGRSLTIDPRGRLAVPAWLRRLDTALLVGAHTDRALVVITATDLLDPIGDTLTAAPR